MMHLNVGEIMTTDTISIRMEETVDEACGRLLENKVSGLPVVDSSRTLVGIISEKDLLTLMYDFHTEDVSIDHYVTRDAISVMESQSIVEATDIFLSHGFRRLPVVDEHNRLIGVLARCDVLRFIRNARAKVGAAMAARH
jgi:CBS domain-containing protein